MRIAKSRLGELATPGILQYPRCLCRSLRRRLSAKSGPRGGRIAGYRTMSDDFEDHCWKDIVTPDLLDIYSHYRRKTFVGPAPVLLAIDLYELVYRGGAKPPAEL